jgi:hypothetical protein
MIPKFETPVSRLFLERKRYYAAQGIRGRRTYELLAIDSELPTDVETEDAAAILGLQPDTLRVRRRLKKSPPYTRRFGERGITYALCDLCDELAKGTVELTAAE